MAFEDLAPKEFLAAYNAQKDHVVLLDVRNRQKLKTPV